MLCASVNTSILLLLNITNQLFLIYRGEVKHEYQWVTYYFYEQTAQLSCLSRIQTLLRKVKYQLFLQLLPAHFWARCVVWAYARTLNGGNIAVWENIVSWNILCWVLKILCFLNNLHEKTHSNIAAVLVMHYSDSAYHPSGNMPSIASLLF